MHAAQQSMSHPRHEQQRPMNKSGSLAITIIEPSSHNPYHIEEDWKGAPSPIESRRLASLSSKSHHQLIGRSGCFLHSSCVIGAYKSSLLRRKEVKIRCKVFNEVVDFCHDCSYPQLCAHDPDGYHDQGVCSKGVYLLLEYRSIQLKESRGRYHAKETIPY